MIDFHSHIIPQIDDGSRSMEETISMLREAKSVGFNKIISTSHYYLSQYVEEEPQRKNSLIEIANKFYETTGEEIKLILGSENFECENFSKDTRQINKGDIYIGIKGEKFDGSRFWKQALDKGAEGVIIGNIEILEEEKNKYNDKIIIQVENTLEALYKIAEAKRNLYDIPVIAITGSVGKTSSKDIIANVVSKKCGSIVSKAIEIANRSVENRQQKHGF